MVQFFSSTYRSFRSYIMSRYAFPLTLIGIAVVYVGFQWALATPAVSYDLQRDHFHALENWNPSAFQANIDQNRICPITAYGASRVDALATARAINQATVACSSQGGGVVVVPPGTWPTGPFTLMSNIELRIEAGAILIFSKNIEDYSEGVRVRFEGVHAKSYQPLIYGLATHNVHITGGGTLIGNGTVAWHDLLDTERKSFLDLYKLAETPTSFDDREPYLSDTRLLRPSFLSCYDCSGIEIDSITLKDFPRWGIHMVFSDMISIHDLTIDTMGPNTDGIVIDSSKDVVIERAMITSGDDAIAIKSGLQTDGWKDDDPSQKIAILDTQVSGAHGGIAIGSEMSGGVDRVLVRNFRAYNVENAVRVKVPNGRGGYVRDVLVDDLVFENVEKSVLHIDADYAYNTVEKNPQYDIRTPDVQRLYFENIRGSNAQRALEMDGFDGQTYTGNSMIFRNIDMDVDKGIAVHGLHDAIFQDITLRLQEGEALSIEDGSSIAVENLSCAKDVFEKCFSVMGASYDIRVTDPNTSRYTRNPWREKGENVRIIGWEQ